LFTSTTNGVLRFGTIDAAKSLANKGRLTVVTLGTADFSLISNISSNIIPWNDMSQLPNNWPDLFWNAYDCKFINNSMAVCNKYKFLSSFYAEQDGANVFSKKMFHI
jgi:hypothetical protein